MNKIQIYTALLLFSILLSHDAICSVSEYNKNAVVNRNKLEQQARQFAEAGNLDRALDLYKEALKPENINYEYQTATAEGAMREIYKWKEEYEKSLAIVNMNIQKHPNLRSNLIEKQEIEALVEYNLTKNKLIVLDHINFLKNEYATSLPPNGYGSTEVISDILRLYNTIGDHELGIEYIDMILDWAYKNQKEFKGVKRFNTTAEIGTLYEWKGPGKTDPNWRQYEWTRGYLLVREAFEKDKKEGTKGSATKALIQSDYFPW